MSTDFYFKPRIREEQLLASAQKLGFMPVYDYEGASKGSRYPIGEELRWAWIYIDDDNHVGCVTRFGLNIPDWLEVVAADNDVHLISEHELQEGPE